MAISEAFRLEILKLRARGFKQYQIARKARVQPCTLSAIANGIIPVRPGDARVLRVARIIGLEPADCFTPDDPDDDAPAPDDRQPLLFWDPRRRASAK